MKLKLLLITTALFVGGLGVKGQTTVFIDDFNRTTLSPGGTPSMTYTNTVATGVTVNTNSSTNLSIAHSTTSGVSFVSGLTSTFSSPYNTTLTSNTNVITWTFNFRWNRPSSNNPAQLASGAYGQAIVLAASGSNFIGATTGYAIVYGNSGTPDPIRLVRFNDLDSSVTNVITSGASDIANTNNYVSVRVTFDPTTDTWALFVRDDGALAWSDPSTGVTTQKGINTVNITYTNTPLTHFGFVWSHANSASNTGDFDNFKVSVASTGNIVTFNGNGSITGSMSNQTASTATNLTTNAFSRTGYTFAGWNTIAGGGGTSYTNEQSYPFFADTTLYAQWTPNNNTITLDKNAVDATGTMANQTIATDATAALTSNGFARTGYTFAGWATTVGGAVAYIDGANYTMGTANVTLYAVWTAVGSYTVIFNANGGMGTMANQTANTATALTTNAFTRAGFIFAGWNTIAVGGGTSYANGASYPFTANETLYAQWTATYTFTYNGNSSTAGTAPTDASSPYVTGATVTVKTNTGTLVRTGYTFAGWNTLSTGLGTNYAASGSATLTMPSANTILYAKWTPNNNTITFDGNGFTGGSTGAQTLATAATANLTTNGYTRTGYSFAGWATTAVGVVAYTNSASYTMGTANVTLFAKWTANNNTVTFDKNAVDAAGTTATQTIATAATAALTTNGFTRTGYTFDGWATTAGGAVAYANGANYTMGPANVTLYAKWVVYTGPCFSMNGPDFSATTGYSIGGDTDAGGSPTTTIRLASGSQGGSISTTATGVTAGDVTVKFRAKGWSGTEISITVTLDGNVQNITTLPTAFGEVTLNFTSISANPTLTFSTITDKRVHIGNVQLFCASVCTPTVITPTAASITTTTATLGGNIISIGCSSVTTRGVEWSTTSGFTTGTQVATSGSFGTGLFTQAVTGLPPGTVIYYKAFATNTEGTGHSTQASFTTPITNDLCSGATSLTINAAAKSAVMNGSTLTAPFTEKDVWFSFTPSCSGTHNITVTGFSGDIDIELYSVACHVSTTAFDTSSGSTTTETITNSLTAGTTYYLRVLAFNTTAETTAFSAQVTSVSTLAINNTGSPAAGLIITGTSNVVVMGFTTTPNCATSYNLTAVTISKTGTSIASDISNLRIFYDANSNGVIDGGESSVSGAGITLTNSMAFTLSGQTSLTTTRNYLLVADVSASATGGNTFIGKITNSTNLSAVLTPTGTVTGTAAGNTQTITYSGPEINVTNNTPSSIPTGSIANTGFNTQFAATAIGSSTAAKTYRIYNLGSTTLNVSAVTSNSTEFTVTSSTPYAIAPGAYVSFTVIFSPSNAGTRNAVISIVNNDITNAENPYTFNVKGDGTCAATTNTITPTSGPIGTEVTVNSAANLTGATVSFNGISATVIQVSPNQIKVVVPASATSGNLITTNLSGCSSTNAFTVIDNTATTCQGGNTASDLFISEVTDSNWGGLTYVEIYNGTGVSKNLSGYSINTASNGKAYSGSPLNLSNVTLASGSTYVVAFGDDDLCTSLGGDGYLAVQSTVNLGVNFKPNENDHIALFNGATKIDSWGTFGSDNWATSSLSIFATETNGATFRRKNTALTLPSTTYANADWEIIDYIGNTNADCGNNDYSSIGTYNFIAGTPPSVATPTYTANCKTATLTILGTEGFTGENPLTYQWLVSAPNATGWTEIANGTNYSGSSTATLSIANISTVINYQYYCQVRENTNTCYTASNAVKIIDGTITWNGTVWRDVNNTITTPSLSKLAVINANYDTSTKGSFDACSLLVNSSFTLTINPNEYVNIQNDLTNNGTVIIEDKGSLVMIDDSGIVTNSGTINVIKTTTPFEKYDYTYWSTPIDSTNIETTFATLQPFWRTDNAYEFLPANYLDNDNDGFDDNHNDWFSATDMIPGKGYIIMVPESQIPDPPVTSAKVIFSGNVNNGIITTPIALTPAVDPAVADDDFNLVGNPYPSAIYADALINANISTNGTGFNTIEGTLYFWTHIKDLSSSNSGPDTYNFSQDDYAVYTLIGGTAAGSGGVKPLGYISSCQGFFVEAINSGNLIFNNSMRVGLPATANSQFFKSRPKKSKIASKDRIWLNLENSLGMFSQQLVGYFVNTSLGHDNGYDGLLSDAGNYVAFYSFINDKTYKIQGRAAYDENDQVRLGYFSAVTGTFNINIDSKEGVFNNLSTSVYLEDKLLNVIYDLNQAPYTFTTEKGTFNDRFILRYTNKTLGTEALETLEKHVLVSNKNKQITVNSAVATIDKVLVYDLLGRLLFKKDKVNSNELSILNLISSQQTVLVKVSLQNGQTITKKIIY